MDGDLARNSKTESGLQGDSSLISELRRASGKCVILRTQWFGSSRDLVYSRSRLFLSPDPLIHSFQSQILSKFRPTVTSLS